MQRYVPVVLVLSIFAECVQGGLPPIKPKQKPMVVDESAFKLHALDANAGVEVVQFAKSIYSALGSNKGDVNQTVQTFRDRFQELNATTDGQLPEALAGLYEIRLLDLQSSIRHAKKMMEVVQGLSQPQRLDLRR